ncbi:LppM family (lipo)protein [Mycobacterium sp.]|uniref:LppM family (lipo)protein n=1 Tax=Mycobacterium sp. TaxID=1785 RepID=UPI003A84F5B6
MLVPLATGCLRARVSLTISPDDLVSGEIVAASKPSSDKDPGPHLDTNLPFSEKIAISNYDSNGYVGSQAVFSDLTFSELPQLANLNPDAVGTDLSLRRNGSLVILEGRVDLTSVTDPDADVELTVSFPGEVTSSNGDRIEPEVVQWKLRPGVVSTMTAQSHYADPNTRAFTGASIWMAILAIAAAGVVAALAWNSRDRSPRISG